jgi:hypothetical protein
MSQYGSVDLVRACVTAKVSRDAMQYIPILPGRQTCLYVYVSVHATL